MGCPAGCPNQKDQTPPTVDKTVKRKSMATAKRPPTLGKKTSSQLGTKPKQKRITPVDGGIVVKADAVELVRTIPAESVDLVIFDPAYESLEKHRKVGTTTRLKQSKASSNIWFETFPNARYPELFKELHRVLKPGTFLYMFCDEETRDIVCCGRSPQTGNVTQSMGVGDSPVLGAGFKYWKSLIWNKVHAGMGYHFRAQHEFIIMAEKVERKGKHRQLGDKKLGDVLSHSRLKGKQYYPTEKPFGLIEDILLPSCEPGETALDPFCGSGVLGQVCRKHGRKFILGDILPDEAIKRLRDGFLR
jgi:site-specific DNA-methyltransferase (adenine-specific)